MGNALNGFFNSLKRLVPVNKSLIINTFHCANGKAGQLITKEAVNRGEDVTAFVRGDNKSVATKAVQKDLFKITKEDLLGFDVVIDAFGAWTPETFSQHSTSVEHLCDILNGTKIRLLIVGGAGCLYVNNNGKKTMIIDTPDFPEMFKPLAKAEVDAFWHYKKTQVFYGHTFVHLLISKQMESVLDCIN